MSTLTDRPRARLSYNQIRERLRTVKRQHARKARANRQRIERVHQQLPKPIRTIFGDDTVTEHPGPHVYGKGRHRDPVRSTHTYTAFRWGHKWVVLALLIPVPWAT